MVGKKIITIIIMVLLMINLASALCDFQFVTYYGKCETMGDIRVYDDAGNLLVEQLFTTNKGCYNESYAISIPGGSNKDCLIQEGDNLHFTVSKVPHGVTEWNGKNSMINYELNRFAKKQIVGDAISPNLLYLLLVTLTFIVLGFVIIEYYRRKRWAKK
jgi:hypothetical protein